MRSKYNYMKIFLDVIKFKLSIKNIKKFQKISDICDRIEIQKVSVSDLIALSKYKPKDIISLIKFHNKYVINEDDKISIQIILKNLYYNSNKYQNIMNFNKIPIFDMIKEIETLSKNFK